MENNNAWHKGCLLYTSYRIATVPIIVVLVILLAVLVNFLLTATTYGKSLLALGQNKDCLLYTSGCDVLGEEGEWLQIKSGKVEGYIKAEYAVSYTHLDVYKRQN